VKKIKEHNLKGLSWWEAVNEFTDLTENEFENLFDLKPRNDEEMKEFFKEQARFLGNQINFDEDAEKDEIIYPQLNDVNWGNSMSPVRYQGSCGSCWAFATMATIEGVHAIKTKKNTPWLSTQQLVDCDKSNGGCKGGWMSKALTYLMNCGGSMLDSDYQYLAKPDSCKFDKNKAKYKVKSYSSCDSTGWFSKNNPCTKDKWRSLLQRGPVSVIVTAKGTFQNYGGGIIDTSKLTCEKLDHAVVAFAWSTQNGKGVISVRNSWGKNWGDKGNFHIYYSEHANNTCWITKMAFLPVI